MNHAGNNGGPEMKRRLAQDPRQRLQQNRQAPNGTPLHHGGRFPNAGRGMGGHQGPMQNRHLPMMGRGPPARLPQNGTPIQHGGHFPGNARGIGGHQVPAPGRHLPVMGRGPPPRLPPNNGTPIQHGGHFPGTGRGMGGHQAPMPGRPPPMLMGGGHPPRPPQNSTPMQHGGHFPGTGRGAPMPGRHQRGPFLPPTGMHNSQGQMHQVPPAPPVIGFGQNRMGLGSPPPPPPPPPRPPFAPPHQKPQHQLAPQMHHPRHVQPSSQLGSVPHVYPQQQQQQQQQQPHHVQRPQPNQFPRHGQLPLQANASHSEGTHFPTMPPAEKPSQHPMVVAATSPKKVSAPYSQTQIDQAWTEYANDKGVKYYHNSILQTSTYTKPNTFVSSQQSQQPSAVNTTATPSTTVTTPRQWAEYTDASTGKKYYSNGVTTTWEKPDGFVSTAAIVAQSNVREETSTSESAKKKRKIKSEKETPFRNNEEALAAFKGLLLAKEVLPTAKWNDVVKMCSSDTRWEDCEAVLTTGERKQAMAEYQTKRANELRTKERQERARAKDTFLQLLTEVLPKQTNFSVWTSRFGDIRDSISKDDRFYVVQDEESRESLFLDFCEELRKHDERKKRNKKREAQEGFNSFLKEKEEAGTLSFSSTWNSFLSSLHESDKEDSRFKVSSFMTDSDRQVFFADFVIDLQGAEDDKRRRIRDARRRAEKAQRDAYRDALERLASEGKLTPSSHWRDIERIIESDSTYPLVQEQDRDAPREIFEELVEEWEEIYRRDRQFLSQLVHPTSNREILITKDTKYDEFVKALLEEANASPQTYAEARRIAKTEEPISSARLYFNELLQRAKEKVAVPFRRRGHGIRRGSLHNDSSSEDEGEIIEDGEMENKPETKELQPTVESQPQPKDDDESAQEVSGATNTVEDSTSSAIAIEAVEKP